MHGLFAVQSTLAAKVARIAGNEGPVAGDDEANQFPVFPARLAEPCHVRRCVVVALDGELHERRRQALVDKKLHARRLTTRLLLSLAPAMALATFGGRPRAGCARAHAGAAASMAGLMAG